MNLTQEDIDQAKGFNDLVEIVRDFGLSLKREGRNYRALCPFHSGSETSLIINKRGRWCRRARLSSLKPKELEGVPHRKCLSAM